MYIWYSRINDHVRLCCFCPPILNSFSEPAICPFKLQVRATVLSPYLTNTVVQILSRCIGSLRVMSKSYSSAIVPASFYVSFTLLYCLSFSNFGSYLVSEQDQPWCLLPEGICAEPTSDPAICSFEPQFSYPRPSRIILSCAVFALQILSYVFLPNF